MQLVLPRLYAITDVRLSGLSHAQQVERLARGGARLIQLREKTASPRDFYIDALKAVQIGHSLGARIIVNDRVDIALAIEADGVHLGQDDLPPEEVRTLLGSDRIVGFSTHTILQALEADSTSVDYIAVGPVFDTSTKENPDPVLGLKMLAEIRAKVSKPLVGIGGISLATAGSVIDAGADSVAVISDLVRSSDLAARAELFVAALEIESK
jgi:thiamine-phosphate pyrophosphorylase